MPSSHLASSSTNRWLARLRRSGSRQSLRRPVLAQGAAQKPTCVCVCTCLFLRLPVLWVVEKGKLKGTFCGPFLRQTHVVSKWACVLFPGCDDWKEGSPNRALLLGDERGINPQEKKHHDSVVGFVEEAPFLLGRSDPRGSAITRSSGTSTLQQAVAMPRHQP